MSRLVGTGRFAARSLAVALVFLGGGIFVPRMVEATTSSGDRAIFEPLAPARILDTRFGPSPLAVGSPVGAGAVIDVQVRGVGGVPADATAVVLNVTVTAATASSHLTVFPSGEAPPLASNLNFGVGDTIPNSVTAKIGATGKVAIRNNAGTVHVITDVNGFFRGHDHDDRYDTKAQVDTKITNGLATPNHVGTAQIADGSVGAGDLGANSVNAAKIADGSVGNADLGANSVNAAKIADGSVANADLVPDAVDSTKVQNGTLTLDDLRTTVLTASRTTNATLQPRECLHLFVQATGLPLGSPVGTEFTSGPALPSTVFVVGRTVTRLPGNNPAPFASFDICNGADVAADVSGSRTYTVTVHG